MTFIKGAIWIPRMGKRVPVSIVGFVVDNGLPCAIVVDGVGDFHSADLHSLKLPPRQPIGGGYGRVDAD